VQTYTLRSVTYVDGDDYEVTLVSRDGTEVLTAACSYRSHEGVGFVAHGPVPELVNLRLLAGLVAEFSGRVAAFRSWADGEWPDGWGTRY
jgi:hypothetical protein